MQLTMTVYSELFACAICSICMCVHVLPTAHRNAQAPLMKCLFLKVFIFREPSQGRGNGGNLSINVSRELHYKNEAGARSVTIMQSNDSASLIINDSIS